MTHSSGGSVGLPIPRSITSIPSRRLRYFSSLIRPKRYGGRLRTRGRDLEVVPLDRLVLLGTGIGPGLDHARVSRRTTGGRDAGEPIHTGPCAIGTSSAPVRPGRIRITLIIEHLASLRHIDARSRDRDGDRVTREMLKSRGCEGGSGSAGRGRVFCAISTDGGVDTRCTTRRPNRPRNNHSSIGPTDPGQSGLS